MARRPQRVSSPVITAAAARIDTPGSQNEEQRAKREEAWQRRAWDLYDDLPEVRSAARYYSNSFARCKLVPAIRIGGSDPTPLNPDGDAEQGYTAQEAADAWAVLDRLKSPQGGQSEILRQFGLQLFVPGECHLVGRETESGEERWDVYSSEELTWEEASPGRKFKLVRGGGPKDVVLGPDTVVIRVWNQHPRRSDYADSPVRSALTVLQELVILTQEIQGAALSRISGPGLFMLPKSVQTPPPPNAPEGWVDPKIQDMLDTWATAVQDPSSASRYVPVFMFVEDQIYEQIGQDKLIQWGREADAVMAEQREHLLRRFRTAIDLPADYDQIASQNHWNAWFIPQEAFQRYIEPGLGVVEDSLTTRYFWPALETEGVNDPTRFVVWHDASGLITRPDRTTDALNAHKEFLISNETTRREMGYSEDDAPTPEELAARAALLAATRGTPGAIPSAGLPGSETQRPPAGAAVVQAELSGRPLPNLDRTLARIDAGLLRDLQSEAAAAMRRVLERANARLASLAGKQPAARELIAGMKATPLQVIPTLGPGLVKRLTAAEDPTRMLLDGAFDGLSETWTSRTGRSVDELLAMAQRYGTLSDVQIAGLRAQIDQDSAEGWTLLLAALTSLAATLLYNPEGVDRTGEFDGTLVPAGLVKRALARAGGGGELAPGIPASSLLNGATIAKLWAQAGISFEAWRWDYGDPGTRLSPFEPHRALDGIEFTSWDDEQLGNASGEWPYVSYWSPQDHDWCQCLATRIGAQAGTVTDEPLTLSGRG